MTKSLEKYVSNQGISESIASRRGYVEECRRLGIEPDFLDIADLESAERVYEEGLFADILNSEKEEQYRDLVKIVNESGVNVESIFRDISKKKKILKQVFGYSGLNGINGEVIPFRNCKDARVGQAFLDHYNRARRTLNQ